jgi:hypothetical protein
MGADRVFPILSLPSGWQGEWHFNIYPGAHALTLHPDWAGNVVGEPKAGATMHRLALIYDGTSETLYVDNKGA